jgi:DNA-binding NtrC family response regulator
MPERILIADDDEAARQGLRDLLTREGFRVEEAGDGEAALEKARSFRPAVVIADLIMPRMGGVELTKVLQDDLPFAAIVLLTGQGSIETAVQAMKAGAYDYLTKPVDVRHLTLILDKALERAKIAREVALLRRQLDTGESHGLLGRSAAMRDVLRQVELAAGSTASVLILGESGTGKELVARTVHALSARAKGPYVGVNCAAIPETLLESEIFGHEKGAFTGAGERRIGCFEMADGGTLLLDEVVEMHASVQAKFLRVLEEGCFRRIGGRTEIRVDVRIVAATNKEPLTAIRNGQLREDLYYRLNVFPITIPPLRERAEDIPVLASAFLLTSASKNARPVKRIAPEAMRVLQQYRWPGNVRELRNVIERAVILGRGEAIEVSHLPESVRRPPAAPHADSPHSLVVPIGTTVDEAEKALIMQSLEFAGHNKTRAAEILGISLKTLHNKLNRYKSA